MLFLVIVSLISVTNAENLFPHGRIVGGENAVIETYPYQIAIEIFGNHHCGGSIISENWVLTASHCITDFADYLKIRAGSSISKQNGSVHHVDKIIRHNRYSMNKYGVPFNDIALLHMKEPFKFDDTRQPISLFEASEESTPGVEAVITGWGDTMQSRYDGQLQTVSVPMVSKELCKTAYKGWGYIPEGQICASYYGVGGKDACQGDSGGPLAINGRLAGIVSWGNGCALAEYPGCYTEVAAYRDWIKEYTNV